MFLTATPSHRGANIVGNSQMDQDTDYIAYQLSRPEAEKSTVLKDEVDYIAYQLKDEVDSVVVHFNEIYGPGSAVGYHGDCTRAGFDAFCGPTPPRILVSCGKATEGFDRPQISVVGVLRNVSPSSVVLFSQFVGRSVRMLHPGDPVTATIVSHVFHHQRDNYNNLDTQATVDPVDE